MADRISAEIQIGGPVPASMVPDLCLKIGNEYLSAQWGGEHFQPKTAADLLGVLEEGGPLCFYHEEARNGEFEELEAFLVEHSVAFCRLSEGKYELMPEQVDFRPGLGRFESLTDPGHNPVVYVSEVRKAIEPLGRVVEREQPVSHLEIAVIWKSINAVLGKEPPPLEPFSICEEQT